MTVLASPFQIDETEAREGKFAGDDPFALATQWLAEAAKEEVNDPTAMALATAPMISLPPSRV